MLSQLAKSCKLLNNQILKMLKTISIQIYLIQIQEVTIWIKMEAIKEE